MRSRGWKNAAGSGGWTARPTGGGRSPSSPRPGSRRSARPRPATSSRSAARSLTHSPPSRSASWPPSAPRSWRPATPASARCAKTTRCLKTARWTKWPRRRGAEPRSLESPVMEQRTAGRLGRAVSVIGLGTWQLGADWGQVDEKDALAVLDAAAEAGVTFFDTADVYGDGRSEQLIGQFLAGNPGLPVTVATKMGRRVPQEPGLYTLSNFRAWTDRSRANLGVDVLDLVQLHCPPNPVYSTDAVYDALDTLVAEQRVAAYGVSVETCDEALTAVARPGTASVQIILNAFRRKPLEQVLPAAKTAGVAIIARVPLASGLLSGKYSRTSTFSADDHRSYNRQGEAFDVGETFSGVDFDTGVDAAQEVAGIAPAVAGARGPDQARQNAAAAALPPLTQAELSAIEDLYDRRIRALVHDRW